MAVLSSLVEVEAVVKETFPQWLSVWDALQEGSSKVHLLKYLLLLRYGGCVTLSSVQCLAPMDLLIAPYTTLLLGIEHQFESL